MESENLVGDSFETRIEPKKGSKKILFIFLIVIAVVIVAVLVYVFLLSNGEISIGPQDELYFKGAYANYGGSTTYFFMTVDFSMRMEIVDLNSTHVKTLLNMTMQSNVLGTLFDEQETTWAPKHEIGTITWEKMEGYSLVNSYEDHVYVEGLGTRKCKIYEFSSTDSEDSDLTITVYVDDQILWPIKFSLDTTMENQTIYFDISLKDTNIMEFNLLQ